MGVSRKQSAPNFPKNEHFQGVRNARFLENLAWFVFLKYLFWDLLFCLITDVFIFYSPRKHLNTKDYFMMFSGELRTLGRNSVMLKHQKIWRALFSWNIRFEIRSFALLPICSLSILPENIWTPKIILFSGWLGTLGRNSVMLKTPKGRYSGCFINFIVNLN